MYNITLYLSILLLYIAFALRLLLLLLRALVLLFSGVSRNYFCGRGCFNSYNYHIEKTQSVLKKIILNFVGGDGGAEAPSTHGYATAPRHLCLVISITKTRI